MLPEMSYTSPDNGSVSSGSSLYRTLCIIKMILQGDEVVGEVACSWI
jgi:hypothetical protein